MTARQVAFLAYHREPPGMSWNVMVKSHSFGTGSWLVNTPRTFIAARLVDSNWPASKLLDVKRRILTGDTIHVYVAAGNLVELFGLLPLELRQQIKWVTYQKRGYVVRKIRYCPTRSARTIMQ